MVMMKDEILNLINMEDILCKYDIKQKNHMCSCPFHQDKNPSMKIYDKSFYCFSCNKTGDLIQFIQYLFNLSFKDAMNKINYDFNLGLKNNYTYEEKVKFRQAQKKLEYERKRKRIIEQQKKQKFINAAKIYLSLNKILNIEKKNINCENWEDKTLLISNIQDKMEILNLYMDSLYKMA